jgi:hypothetical protein
MVIYSSQRVLVILISFAAGGLELCFFCFFHAFLVVVVVEDI